MRILNILRRWWTRRQIRRDVRRFLNENMGQVAVPEGPPVERDAQPDNNPSRPATRMIQRCEMGFTVTPQMIRDIRRYFERMRKLRRCVYLAQHGKTARVRKKNTKRAAEFDGPLILHIQNPRMVEKASWWARTLYCPVTCMGRYAPGEGELDEKRTDPAT